MNYKIYLIEDINDLKYVGSTTQSLNERLSGHKADKKRNKPCSSSQLNLYNCIIYELEKCNKENKKEREQYWKDTIIDCVNERNMVFDSKEWAKQYYQNNKEKKKEYCKEYNKLHWYCSDCKCNVKLNYKSHHLKTKKHHLNTNNYV